MMIFRKSARKSLFLMVFLLFATTLFAQDFSWDPENGFVVISSGAEETTEEQDEVQVVEPVTITTPVTEPEEETENTENTENTEETAEDFENTYEDSYDDSYKDSYEDSYENSFEDSFAQPENDYEPEYYPETTTEEEVIEQFPEDTQEEETEEEVVEEEPATEKHEYEALALIRYKNTETITFKLKVSYIPKPYILGLSLAAGFTEYKLIQPFYFGGFLEPHVGFPQKAFPYKYELGGTALKGPLIVGGKLYAPFGICVFPFQENIEFFVEFAPGISLNMMWDAKFGNDSITSNMYPAFYGSLRTGASYKGFSLFIEGNYDAILGFGVSAGFGYSLNFIL